MFKIKINSFFSIICSKAVQGLSKKLLKGGSNFPGRVALFFDKNILKEVSKSYKVILITGTNGKTTTTSMIYNIIKSAGYDAITNNTGANMNTGIISCFISNYKFGSNKKEKYAVIEVDEAYLKTITKDVSPEIITVTNLFRDQLDRYGEVYTTYSKILDGIKNTSSTLLVLNGDESLLGEIPVNNPIKYYGFDTPIRDDSKISINADSKFCKKCKAQYEYEFVTYNHLGKYYCPNCGYKRPPLDFKIDNINSIDSNGSSVYIDNEEYFINQSGEYNIYNGLCAYSVATSLNIPKDIIRKSLSSQDSSFGRQEILNIKGKECKIILVKNPAGYDQAIDTIMLHKTSLNLCILLNDNYADGRDVSWIWDVNFEKLNTLNINDIIVSGTRPYDMATRLKVAGLDETHFNITTFNDDLVTALEKCSNNTVYILTTYTAMLSLRKLLHEKGYIKKIW